MASLPLSQAIDEYLAWLELDRHASVGTVHGYRRNLQRFSDFVGGDAGVPDIAELDQELLRGYQRHLAPARTGAKGAGRLHPRSPAGGAAQFPALCRPSHAHDALPTLPAWVDNTAVDQGSVWAPAVTSRDDYYLLYFAARSASQHTHCIGIARAWSPQGPFRSLGSHPLVCQPGDVETIDPKPFTDIDGRHYLLYSTSHQGNATIWLQQLAADGMAMIGGRRAVIRADRADEDHIVEAPAMVRHGGKYVLFYSGNVYNSGRYFTNYATADALCDEFVKHPGQLLNEHTLHDAYPNPGGQDVLHTHGHDFLVFHAYTSPTRRAMFVAELNWNGHDYPGRRAAD